MARKCNQTVEALACDKCKNEWKHNTRARFCHIDFPKKDKGKYKDSGNKTQGAANAEQSDSDSADDKLQNLQNQQNNRQIKETRVHCTVEPGAPQAGLEL